MSNKISNSQGVTLFLVPEDFNYNGTIYMTIFYVPKSLEGNSMVTPQYQQGYGIINGTPGRTESVTLYYTNLNEMYNGSLPIWESVTGAPQVITINPPMGYVPVILFFVQVPSHPFEYVEVGYEWL